MNKNLIKLAIDLAKGQVKNYSSDEANDSLRKAFADLMEFSLEGDGKIDRKTFRRHKTEIFELIEVILNETINEGLEGQFDKFAEYRNLAWGDTNVFVTPANQIFRVALVSDGNGNVRRQRLIDGEEFIVKPETYAIKLGEDFHRFLAGRVEWADFINGIAESFKRDITQRIYEAIIDSFPSSNGTYYQADTTAPNEDDIVEMAMHIQARTGEKVAIHGTKLALRKLTPSSISDGMLGDKNKVGYYGEIAGIELYEIPQSHKYGEDEFAIDNGMLLLLPQSTDKMVKVVNEGDSIVQDQAGGQSSDMMQEYFIANKFGIAVIPSKVFGVFKFQN